MNKLQSPQRLTIKAGIRERRNPFYWDVKDEERLLNGKGVPGREDLRTNAIKDLKEPGELGKQ